MEAATEADQLHGEQVDEDGTVLEQTIVAAAADCRHRRRRRFVVKTCQRKDLVSGVNVYVDGRW